jgi:predicted membrane GTPase involved in stress response
MKKFWKWMSENYEIEPELSDQELLGYMLEYLTIINKNGIHEIKFNDFEQLCDEIKKRIEEVKGD